MGLALGFLDSLVPILLLTVLLGAVFAISQPAEFALVPPLAGEASMVGSTISLAVQPTWVRAPR